MTAPKPTGEMDDAAWDAAIQRRAVDSLAFEAEIALRKDRAALKAERDALRARVEALDGERKAAQQMALLNSSRANALQAQAEAGGDQPQPAAPGWKAKERNRPGFPTPPRPRHHRPAAWCCPSAGCPA